VRVLGCGRLNARPITIAGGGLAGLSLAIGLRRYGVPVTVREAGGYPRHRVCGEFISGVSDETLAALGIANLLADARRHHALAWYDHGRAILRERLPVPARGISRFLLDDRLQRCLTQAGGELVTGARVRPEPAEGFIWAAGRRPRKGRWIGLKAHLRGLPMTADLEMHGGSNGYAGLAGVEDGWINICGLFRIDPTLPARGEALLPAYLEAGGNQSLADAVRRACWRDGSFSAVAGFELGKQESVPGLACIGDAESMIPPFTGNGMSMAFQAAELALEPLLHWARGELAWTRASSEISRRLSRQFRRRLWVARAAHPALFHLPARQVLRSLASARLLPFRPMLSLVR
jgi:menaquinone-9 beta-reductase